MGEGLPAALVGLLVGLLLGGLGVWLTGRRPRPMAARLARATPSRRDSPPTERSTDVGSFADGLGIGVLSLSSERVVVGANESAHRLLGREAPALIGLTALAAFLDHRVDELLATAAEGRGELELASLGEQQRTLHLSAERAGRGWQLALTDVTELRRLQRIRSEFIDNLAHELRTPLTTVRLLTEALRSDAERSAMPAKMRERIAKIDVETGHLVQMVNELLDLSRIEGRASQLQLARVDMAAVLERGVDRLRTFADRQGVRLAFELPADRALPPAWGDAERLGQVLVNLLHNAIKFSPPDTTVTVSATLAGSEIAVAVRDEGIGIARADRERVFERFYKADKARGRSPGGTGLGLSIARHVVEGHGGRIWVDSEEGKGATFTFSVPLADQPAGSSGAMMKALG